MIEIIDVECYFVVLNFNSINENFVWYFYKYISCYLVYLMLFKFCTQYNQCEYNDSVSIWAYIKNWVFW